MCRPMRVPGSASTTLPTRAAKSISRSTSSSEVITISSPQIRKFASWCFVFLRQFAFFIFQFSVCTFPSLFRIHPVITNACFCDQRHVQFNRGFHLAFQGPGNSLCFVLWAFDQQLVMHLHQHLRVQTFAAES